MEYKNLRSAIDSAMAEQRQREESERFNAGRSAFSRIHKSTAADTHSGTGNVHALRNFGGRMTAAILGNSARKNERNRLPTKTGFRAVSGASLKA